MALDLKKFTARFVDEARDHLRQLEDGLAAFHGGMADQETINTVFRSAHTIKGSARMLKLSAINETAHRLEDVLGAMRSGGLAYSAELGRLLERGIDAIAGLVEQVADGTAPPHADPSLCEELSRAAAAALGVDTTALAVEAAEPAPSPDAGAPTPPAAPPPAASAARLKAPDTVRVSMGKLDELIKLMGEVVSSHATLRQRVVDLRHLQHAQTAQQDPVVTGLRDFARDLKDDVLAQELLMEELHRKALVMRMLPLGMVFESAPRMVRELARSMGKDIECSVSGTDIELDRQIIDHLGDPILHLLRNAVDHGVEDPDSRRRSGKAAVGRVHLAARQDAAGVVIEVGDDGGGIPLAAIRDKAVRKKLMTVEQAAALSEAEVIDLIFRPGFSTNAIVTDVSGRGVGMDVVKRCIVDELQGGIQVDTRPGEGTRFLLRLPLSLAVMRVLLVEAGGETFAFTAQQVAHLIRVPPDKVLRVAGRPAVVDHNEFLPVVNLAGLLSLPPRPGPVGEDLLLVVVQVRNEKLAFQVDALVDERDMVIKPLPAHLSHLAMVSGMVVTGRNALVAVLHAAVLMELARKVRAEARPGQASGERPRTRVLVVDDSLNIREIEKDVLEAHGYTVTLAEDGRDGLNKALGGEFDAVLTDVEMPSMDGFALTQALRGDERYRDIPIIIITSRQKEEDKRRGIEVGADAYIVKGDFEQSSLIETLRGLLG